MKRKLKIASNNYRMLKTSWGVQGKLFFEHSTLHGVRYIAENGRPSIEKLLWFICVSIGSVATTVIIFSLWEKFQTNPTITGLDTDFHNWPVPFPALTVCQEIPTTKANIVKFLTKHGERNITEDDVYFFTNLTRLSYKTWSDFVQHHATKVNTATDYDFLMKYPIKKLVFDLTNTCEEVFDTCNWKTVSYNCCDGFFPVFTENGFCYTFNSRHHERKIPGRKAELPGFDKLYIKETDLQWSIKFEVRSRDTPFPIYILNSEEIASIDVQPQHIWDFSVSEILFSVKETFTTKDTAQLSIKQRRCAFPDEVKLKVDDIYTYTACTRQCRMDTAMRLCECVPYFYPEVDSYKHCEFGQLKCINTNLEEIKSVDKCSCYLGCSNTVYEVEEFDDDGVNSDNTLEVKFVSWPMVRYKREVLFGWVDLLVSFGGIAGLFLGFSLLSGVELLYYFTVRAWCMVVRERDELQKIQLEEASKPLTDYDLSLVPYFISDPLPGNGINEIAKRFYHDNLLSYSNKVAPIRGRGKLKPPSRMIIPPFGIEFIN